MYIEILIIGVILFALCIYNGIISTSKFFGENKNLFGMLQEKDYEFLVLSSQSKKSKLFSIKHSKCYFLRG
jgi:uncharacterized FlgJ-related protein